MELDGTRIGTAQFLPSVPPVLQITGFIIIAYLILCVCAFFFFFFLYICTCDKIIYLHVYQSDGENRPEAIYLLVVETPCSKSQCTIPKIQQEYRGGLFTLHRTQINNKIERKEILSLARAHTFEFCSFDVSRYSHINIKKKKKR
jgi:hypothetical protein